ncbi:DUF4132 domain-containing protein [Ottowia testudinis]|uniref:DUF4132 domain-containing protein n=1 Tax=Ottowia testudinis TaxID=2816950 RepID=A0A975CLY3_9BURK|nr:DUF4132 domain-containing protein [Ottowia testudinis]QTD46619.1 DUF4132 domain-containing protein [Ottowia testudinis]
MASKKPAQKTDPLLARPDGTRAKSAWLTKVQAAVPAIEEKGLTTTAFNGLFSLRRTNTLQANADYLLRNHGYPVVPSGQLAAGWECLLQWHGEAALASMGTHVAEKDVLKLVCTFHTDAAQDVLLAHLGSPLVREAVAERALLWPIDTLRRLLAHNPSRDQSAAHLLQHLLHDHPDWLAPLQTQLQAEGDDAQAKTLARLLTPAEQVTEASADELPPLLREPPWRAGAGRAELPVLALQTRREPATVDWSRWPGAAVEPRPQARSNRWITLAEFKFDANPSVLLDFVAANGTLSDALLQALRTEAQQPLTGHRYSDYRTPYYLGDRKQGDAAFDTLLRFLQTAAGLSEADADAMRQQPDAHWTVGARCLDIGYTPYRVDADFDDLCEQWQRAGPQGEVQAAALRAQADVEWQQAGKALLLLGVKPERITALLAGDALTPGDVGEPPSARAYSLDHLGHVGDALALPLLRALDLNLSALYRAYHGDPMATLLKRFGAEQLDLILPTLSPAHQSGAQQIMDLIDSDTLALHLSDKGFTGKLLRPYARRWLLARPRTAARALIPPAFSADAKQSAHARFHLYALAQEGHDDALRAEATAYGAGAENAVQQLLATPPESLLPAQMPKLPGWLNLPRLPRLLLRESGHAVPLAHMPDALMPLALSKGGMAYAGLDKLQDAVTPESLARLLRGLFEQWAENDMPAKDRWIFELQGRLGDDATARLLAPHIRAWRSHLDRVRSYEGLEMLTQIGSDTALMLLAAFTEQKRYTDLQDRATKALTRIAEERGLTLDELADRTVPTLGLDERGVMLLDFGPRQFSASLSADLAPQVFDADGARLKDLPKPSAKDDSAAAKAASSDWKELKKQAKLVAQTQVARLESTMCGQRRWRGADFMLFFVQHPVLRTLAQRVVWAQFAGAQLQASFRVSEDLTLADADDAAFELPADALVGLPHPLELPEALQKQWHAVLADYKLIQPFEQLTRATYALPTDELARGDLPRYASRKVGTGSLLGLESRGWKRQAGDGGMLDHFVKPLGHGLLAELWLDEGWFIAGAPPASDESHELRGVFLSRAAGAPASGQAPPQWADLPAIAISELLRDLEKMAWHTH